MFCYSFKQIVGVSFSFSAIFFKLYECMNWLYDATLISVALKHILNRGHERGNPQNREKEIRDDK